MILTMGLWFLSDQLSYFFYEVKNIIFALLLEVIQVIKRKPMCL